MAELNLEIKTFGIYYGQLLFNLKSGLQDALHLIALDMKAVWAKLQEAPPEKSNSCPICEQTLLHQSYVRKHLESAYFQCDIFKCPVCDETFQFAHVMSAHIEEKNITALQKTQTYPLPSSLALLVLKLSSPEHC